MTKQPPTIDKCHAYVSDAGYLETNLCPKQIFSIANDLAYQKGRPFAFTVSDIMRALDLLQERFGPGSVWDA